MNPLITLEQALERMLAATPGRAVETVPTLAASGRVLAAAQYSGLDVPPLDNTAMDGYALRSADIPAPGTRLPVTQRIPAGSLPQPLAPGSAARIFTGAPIPPGADAVVMQELCERDGDTLIVNHRPAAGEWIRRAGEDIRAGAEVLAAGTRLGPAQVGLAASVGLAALPVYAPLSVACFFTGDELVMPGEPLPPGAIYNSNRYTLRALIEGLGCKVEDFGIVPDRLDATRAVLREAAGRADLIVTSGGVSAGEEDHIKPAVMAEGQLEDWKLAIKPGRPLAFGRVRGAGREALFVGLPGNPVSSFVTFLLLVRPLILHIAGCRNPLPPARSMEAGFDWPKPDARREFLRARVAPDGRLELFPNQSSGVLTSMAWADGLIDNPPKNAIARGDRVRFLAFSDLLN
ncbi:MAG: molybdopterin molybdotransferase MoeA [Rhodocyclaceae bacterium]|nr:molybdopterin molybdotransferase MoeA [Rhodocyclaceae bacterium]MBX3670523.1 molybdopterin molybdotransferase MoeA [Rhodocyclaceae bacterium]